MNPVKNPITRLVDWWRVHFLGAELGVALALGAAFALWELALGGAPWSDALLRGNRAAVYGALASLWGSLLGFTIAAVSIALGLAASDRLAIVRGSRHYATLWRVFIAAMRALALATIAALAGLVADRDAAPVHALLCLCVAAALLAALRVARTIWVFERLIAIVTRPPKARGPG
jgi:signal transduction histidine kinase